MNLGWLHYYGYGVEQDLIKAFGYYSKAQSIPQAKYYLGLMYAEGLGTEINNEKAYELFSSAYNNGVIKAKEKMNIAKALINNAKT